jgi:betaine-aldehyde dehydrogenase
MLPKEYNSFMINGEWRPADSTKTIDVVNPTNGQKMGSVPSGSLTDIDAAVEAARHAFYETDWSRRPVEERAELAEALAEKIHENQDALARLFVEETGATRQLADVYQAVAPTLHWNYNAAVARTYPFREVRTSDLGPLAGGSAGGMIMPYETQSLVTREPIGVVATFVAYNFALPGMAQKVAPAIVAGCTVVLKVPEPNPLASFAIAEMAREVGFPPGVLNVVAAEAEASAHLAAHEDVDMVSFTGSTEIGAKIGAQAGSQIKKAVLELGGKSAAIVLDDADLETTIPTLTGISVIPSSGQSCVCQSRFLLPRKKHDEIVERLVECFEQITIGDPQDPETQFGPLVTKAQQERVLAMIERAKEQGATIAYGGKVPEGYEDGFYVEPTLITNVTPEMEIFQEEVFGPVVAVTAYDTEQEAIDLANNSKYGLAGSVFTSDVERGFELARHIQVGTFSVNNYAADFNAPFGGYKMSGLGREHGVAGLEEYLVHKTVSVDPSQKLPESVIASADLVTEGPRKGA